MAGHPRCSEPRHSPTAPSAIGLRRPSGFSANSPPPPRHAASDVHQHYSQNKSSSLRRLTPMTGPDCRNALRAYEIAFIAFFAFFAFRCQRIAAILPILLLISLSSPPPFHLPFGWVRIDFRIKKGLLSHAFLWAATSHTNRLPARRCPPPRGHPLSQRGSWHMPLLV